MSTNNLKGQDPDQMKGAEDPLLETEEEGEEIEY